MSVAEKKASVVVAGVVALVAWWLAYRSLLPLAKWLTYQLFGLSEGTHLASAVEFFLYDTPKVLLLLTLVVFAVGVVRSYFTAERARRMLAGKREAAGNVLAALLGIVTPFCSCSAVPLFIGFVTAGVPLGVTFSFLISAPMVNEIALVLLFGLFGWKIAALYLGTGLAIAMVAGWTIGRIRHGALRRAVGLRGDRRRGPERARRAARVRGAHPARAGRGARHRGQGLDLRRDRHRRRRGHPRLRPGEFHGLVHGHGAWWSVPLSVLIGIPMYTNAAGIIPIVEALLGKGAALGTVLAFMMSVIALSLPEMIILRKVLRPQLIATFAGVVGVGIMIVGYLFNAVM